MIRFAFQTAVLGRGMENGLKEPGKIWGERVGGF